MRPETFWQHWVNNMIPVKNERELVIMRKACKITAAARALAGEMVRPGVTTKQIDKAVYEFILSQDRKSVV